MCSRFIFIFGSFGLRWRFFFPSEFSPDWLLSLLALASASLRSASDDISPSFFLLALISGFPCSPFSRLISSRSYWRSVNSVLFSLTTRSMRFSSFLTSASDTLFSSCAISWSMAIISACKSWILKVGKSLFYLAFCQDIPVNFIFTVVFKVDTDFASYFVYIRFF